MDYRHITKDVKNLCLNADPDIRAFHGSNSNSK